MRKCVVAPPGECLQVKTDMVLFAGNTLSALEAFAKTRYTIDVTFTLPLPLYLFAHVITHVAGVGRRR